MPQDVRIDDYIARAQPFARPLLAHLRTAVHRACPEAEEALKWSMPAFLYRGRIMATMAAFKAHAAFGFWRGSELLGEDRVGGAMGQFGRITSIDDLPPPDALVALIRKAVEQADAGPPARAPRRPPNVEIAMPDDLAAALAENPSAARMFDSFAPSARRDYLEWIVEAKRPATRAKRLALTVEWVADGKKRHWQHERR